MMEGLVSWVALFGAGGTIIALVTFWVNRGRAEGEAVAEAKLAREEVKQVRTLIDVCSVKCDLYASQLAKMQVEAAEKYADFAENYASNKDLSAVESRVAAALEGMRTEFRGLNDRLDRLLEHFVMTPRK